MCDLHHLGAQRPTQVQTECHRVTQQMQAETKELPDRGCPDILPIQLERCGIQPSIAVTKVLSSDKQFKGADASGPRFQVLWSTVTRLCCIRYEVRQSTVV